MSDQVIQILDNNIPFKLSHFCIPRHYADSVESVLIPHGLILDRVDKLAMNVCNDILAQQEHPSLVMICVLKGGYQFFSDMLKAITKMNASTSGNSVPISLEFIRVKSYHNDTSTGQVSIELMGNETWSDLGKRFKDKNLLVVEDIIDTGRTMQALLEKLNAMQARTVKVSSLFVKRTPLALSSYKPDYAGFSIPDKFVVGYCLDYNEYYRDLNVCVL